MKAYRIKLTTLFLLMSLIMSVVFVACSKQEVNTNNDVESTTTTTLSQEEIASQAAVADINHIKNDISKNVVDAENKYVNNYYSITGYIQNIKSGQITLYGFGSSNSIDVVLSNDEISGLENSQIIVVVGKISSVSPLKMEDAFIYSKEITLDAEFHIEQIQEKVGNRYKYTDTGVLRTTDGNSTKVVFADRDVFKNYGSGSSVGTTYDRTEINGEVCNKGDRFTISGKAKYTSLGIEFGYGSTVEKK